jgi:hypothetical protein
MHKPENGEMKSDESGASTDIEELRWLVYEAGKLLLALSRNVSVMNAIGWMRAEAVSAVAMDCLESGAGSNEAIETYLTMMKIPAAMKPLMRSFMVQARDVAAEELPNVTYEELGYGEEKKIPSFKMPKDLMDLLNDL